MSLPDGVRRALVVGVGKATGRAVADALLESGVAVRLAERDAAKHSERLAELAAKGVEVSGDQNPGALLKGCDLVIPAPGVPPDNPILAAAASMGIPIWSEVELGWTMTEQEVLAVTGTNGKTTTVELLTAALRGAGIDAVACGNIGFPLVEAARRSKDSVLVCEVSSFQLHFTRAFHPKVAAVLNLSADHLDWHGDLDAYARSKGKITANQSDRDHLIVNGLSEHCLEVAAGSRAGVHIFGSTSLARLAEVARSSVEGRHATLAGIDGESLVAYSNGEYLDLMTTRDIRLIGRGNIENVLAVFLAGLAWGLAPKQIAEAVESFEPRPHRLQRVGQVRGVMYVNDSKATNPHATLAAIEDLERVVLIAGGRAKGVDLSILKGAEPKLRAVVVMGEAAAELERVFESTQLRHAGDMNEAVSAASSLAVPGDTVLLSPACSSLDQYEDYKERGERFMEEVRTL